MLAIFPYMGMYVDVVARACTAQGPVRDAAQGLEEGQRVSRMRRNCKSDRYQCDVRQRNDGVLCKEATYDNRHEQRVPSKTLKEN